MTRSSGRRKILFAILTLAMIPLGVEAGLHLVYLVARQQVFPFGEYQSAMDAVADFELEPDGKTDRREAARIPDYMGRDVLHPFLGFALDPRRGSDISYLGFPEKYDDPLAPRDDGVTTILVVGGSFAQGTSDMGEPIIQAALRNRGIESRIITGAMGGYKEPQQLMTLAFLLSLGAQVDVVVNIDGFNEVALTPLLRQKKINPFYPRSWNLRVADVLHPAQMRQAGRVWILRDQRRRRAEFFKSLPGFSISVNILWRALDGRTERRLAALEEEFQKNAPRSKAGFLHRGPDLGIEEGDEFFNRLADHWVRSSILLKHLCEGEDIAYLHFLQPNQYYETERTLTDEEMRIAFKEDHPYRPGVVAGYPRLLEASEDLLEAGVDFHDMTLIYDDVDEPVYMDDCCHVNMKGYEVFGTYVGEKIADALERRATEGAAPAGN